MRRLEKNLETQLDNERLQCRRANATIKELQEEELVETNQLITKVLSDSNVRVKVLQDNLDSLKAEFEPTTLELEKCKQMIQNKDNEI